MSLLKVLGDILGSAKKIGNELQKQTNQFTQQRPAQPQPVRETPQAQTPKAQEPAKLKSAYEWQAYFREILKTEFPQFNVQENVSVTSMVGDANDTFKLYKDRPAQAYKAEWGQPYSFVLTENGANKAVVMLGSGHSHDSSVKFLISRMYAKKCGMPYINFYTQMPNEKDYVVERIKRFI